MKKRVIKLIFMLLFIFILSSCNRIKIDNINNTSIETSIDELISYEKDSFIAPTSNNQNGIKITYNCNNGFIYESKTNEKNKIIKPITSPSKKASKFTNWYYDEKCSYPVDFNKEVSIPTTIYAGYETDFIELANMVSEDILYSSIQIISRYYNSSDTSFYESSGSGVIISVSDKYYCLTNNHVVYRPNEYRYNKYEIHDSFNNTYNADLLYYDVNYDLALLSFDKNEKYQELKPIYFSNSLPNINDLVISIGNPLKMMNVITYGYYEGIKKYTANPDTVYKSNINFNVIHHSAMVKDGSSGGILLDSNLRLIGINFAAAVNSNNEYEYSYAIPYEKIIEFINNYIKNVVS